MDSSELGGRGDRMNLILATPVRAADDRTAIVTIGYHNFVCAMMTRGADRIDGSITFCADIVRGRNRIAAKILRDKPNATHVLWCDDDQWPHTLDVVDRMVSSGEDVIGAVYTNKREPLRFVFQPWVDGEAPKVDERGIADVRGVGFGFTMTSRSCLERMAASVRWYRDLPDDHDVPNMFEMAYDRYADADVFLSEDYAFCKRWRDLGGRIKLLSTDIIYHSGAKAWSAKDARKTG